MSLSRSSGVATEIVRASATVRLAIPVSTPPGPSSAYSVTPRSSSSSRQCFQRTGDESCAESRLAHSLPSWWGSASTLATTGTSVSRGSASAIAPRNGTRAEIMYGVWNAPDTGSAMTFLAPSSRAWSDAEATPVGEPAMTTCPGAL